MANYEFVGWSKENNNIPDPQALKNIQEDTERFACWEEVKPTVTVVNGNQTVGSYQVRSLEELSTPTRIIAGQSQTFTGWSTENRNVPQSNIELQDGLTVYACFDDPLLITDTWEEIHANTVNGTYKTKYKQGMYKLVNYGSSYGYNVPMEVVVYGTDNLTSGGKAPITWLAKDCIKYSRSWGSLSTTANLPYSKSGAYSSTKLLENTVRLSTSNPGLNQCICQVKKAHSTGLIDNKINIETLDCYLWIPCNFEIYINMEEQTFVGSTSSTLYAPIYSENNYSSRTKYLTNATTKVQYWSRTSSINVVNNAVSGNANIEYYDTNGILKNINYVSSTSTAQGLFCYICPGFCTN